MNILSANKIFNKLNNIDWKSTNGYITFNLADIGVILNTTDTVGVTLQSWLKQYFIKENIYFREPLNTQEFPDFYLSKSNEENLLEVKAFHYCKSPAFDIANFESYCDSLKTKPYRLFADYIIFGYEMDNSGKITIEDIWLKKIWEISGSSAMYPLKTQVKRGMIYNIRPNSAFKNYKPSIFNDSKDFIEAIYKTLQLYKGNFFAEDWYREFTANYLKLYEREFK